MKCFTTISVLIIIRFKLPQPVGKECVILGQIWSADRQTTQYIQKRIFRDLSFKNGR